MIWIRLGEVGLAGFQDPETIFFLFFMNPLMGKDHPFFEFLKTAEADESLTDPPLGPIERKIHFIEIESGILFPDEDSPF